MVEGATVRNKRQRLAEARGQRSASLGLTTRRNAAQPPREQQPCRRQVRYYSDTIALARTVPGRRHTCPTCPANRALALDGFLRVPVLVRCAQMCTFVRPSAHFRRGARADDSPACCVWGVDLACSCCCCRCAGAGAGRALRREAHASKAVRDRGAVARADGRALVHSDSGRIVEAW